jgi:formate dehydrogenase iron-sulfur subunit
MEPTVELPLLERMQQLDAAHFPLLPAEEESTAGSFCGARSAAQPLRTPAPGEQYRFHFDMTKCIGCKCCVVACNEQNGNPADILWRRVGEIEGGTYPATLRHYLSVGCNHCLEPTCMTGCPVSAYEKDSITGIVRHSADACIGCQYCTWNCSYGVPQYNPERGVVGKCDMCYGRLTRGQDPACASACPESAIEIELVNIDEWRREYKTLANSPGMPSADDSISTTRLTLPRQTPRDLQKVNLGHLHAEQPHWPLIVMTVLTQLSVGAFAAIWRMQRADVGMRRVAVLLALGAALLALSASTFHLGRPIHAARALKMWRRSWLSREVLLFTIFAGAGTAYSVSSLLANSLATAAGAATVLFGVAGVGASARLYLVPGRPAWNSLLTVFEFYATAATLGFGAGNVLSRHGSIWATGVLLTAAATIAVLMGKLTRLALSSRYELYASWQLLSTILLNKLLLRLAILIGGVVFAVAGERILARLVGLLLIIAGEFISRYLFFVSVVPTNIASGYLRKEAA